MITPNKQDSLTTNLHTNNFNFMSYPLLMHVYKRSLLRCYLSYSKRAFIAICLLLLAFSIYSQIANEVWSNLNEDGFSYANNPSHPLSAPTYNNTIRTIPNQTSLFKVLDIKLEKKALLEFGPLSKG